MNILPYKVSFVIKLYNLLIIIIAKMLESAYFNVQVYRLVYTCNSYNVQK